MPLNDHVLLLQLERAYEAIEDKVDDAVDPDRFADYDHDHDEYAWADHDHDESYAGTDEVSKLREQLLELSGIVTELAEKVEEQDEVIDNLIKILRGTGHRV